MSKDGFFGDIFDSPDDDPLLQSDPDRSPSASDDVETPSWMDDDSFMDDGTEDTYDDVPVEMQEVVVAPNDGNDTLDQINEAIDHGWRLAHITLTDKQRAAVPAGEASPRFVVTIERDIPRSLFDFGPNR